MVSSVDKSPDHDNLMLIVGQLLEAARTASEGLKSTTAEVRANALAVATILKTIESIEEAVDSVHEVIFDPKPGNLIGVVTSHTNLIATVQGALARVENTMDTMRKQLDSLKTNRATIAGASNAFSSTAQVLGWLITTGIALYAAISQWIKP